MRVAALALMFSLVLAACAADPLARAELRDLDHVWAELQAGVRADDPSRLAAVLAPSADPEVAPRIVYLLGASESGRAVRDDLLAAGLDDLRPAGGEVEAPGQVLKFESSRRKPAADGLPPFDTGFTIYIQLLDGQAGLYDTLAWSRRADGAP